MYTQGGWIEPPPLRFTINVEHPGSVGLSVTLVGLETEQIIVDDINITNILISMQLKNLCSMSCILVKCF